jgi:hypothetical protein
MARIDIPLLHAALAGYEAERQRIEQAIVDIRKRLGKRVSAHLPTTVSSQLKKAHRISPEGRARIAEAQRRRWAAAKNGKAAKQAK